MDWKMGLLLDDGRVFHSIHLDGRQDCETILPTRAPYHILLWVAGKGQLDGTRTCSNGSFNRRVVAQIRRRDRVQPLSIHRLDSLGSVYRARIGHLPQTPDSVQLRPRETQAKEIPEI